MNRKYPDIDFVDTNAENIMTELIQGFETITGRTLYPASPEKLFIAWVNSIIVQQRVIINETAKKNVPRYADGEFLDSLAELFKDVQRLEPEKATATFRCYISEPQEESVFIPSGTRVTADGDVFFALDDIVEIPAGQTYADGKGTCIEPGTIGNGYEIGQVKQIVDLYSYFEKIENITATGGGTDEESDDDFYERMRESEETYSTAGPVGSYLYHARSASAAVQDVVPTSPTPGVCEIRVLLKEGTENKEGVLKIVEEALSAEKVRPFTDKVVVKPPEVDEFDVDVTYYIPREQQANAITIDAAAKAAVQEYIAWQTEKMGRDINPSQLVSQLMATGVKRVEVNQPTYKTVEETHIAKLGTSSIKNGGIENG